MNKQLVGTSQAALSASCFGIMGFLGSTAYAEGISVYNLMTFRFGIAGIIFLSILIYKFKSKKVGYKEHILKYITPKYIAVGFIFGAIGYAGQAFLVFSSIKYIPTGLASILLYTYPTFVILIDAIFFKKSPSKLLIVSLILGFLGCFLAIKNVSNGPTSLLGIYMGIGAGLWYAIYIKVSEILLNKIPNEITITFMSIGCFTTFLLASIFSDTGFSIPETRDGLGAAFLLAIISTVFAIKFLFLSIEKIGAPKASITSTLEPVIAVLIGVTFLHENLAPSQFMGIIIVLFSVILTIKDKETVKVNPCVLNKEINKINIKKTETIYDS